MNVALSCFPPIRLRLDVSHVARRRAAREPAASTPPPPLLSSAGVMPKHGLDVGACEVFRFYKLVTLKGLIEPISMIVPRRVRSRLPRPRSVRPLARAARADRGRVFTLDFLNPVSFKIQDLLLSPHERDCGLSHRQTI